MDGERYVQDGRMTTTAGVSSAIPGSLRLVQDLAGRTEAQRVARSFTFPGWSLDGSTRIPKQRLTIADLGIGLNFGLPWLRPVVGISLASGVRETDVAAVFEVYNMSSAARTVAVPMAPRSPPDTVWFCSPPQPRPHRPPSTGRSHPGLSPPAMAPPTTPQCRNSPRPRIRPPPGPPPS